MVGSAAMYERLFSVETTESGRQYPQSIHKRQEVFHCPDGLTFGFLHDVVEKLVAARHGKGGRVLCVSTGLQEHQLF